MHKTPVKSWAFEQLGAVQLRGLYQSGVFCVHRWLLYFYDGGSFRTRSYVEWLTDLGLFEIGGRELRKTTMPVRWKKGFDFSEFILWGRTNSFSGEKLQQISTPYGRLL